MDKSPSTEPQKGSSSPPGGQLQKAATTSLAAAWLVYKSFLAGPVSQVVPEPTREAVFQLFCDIRANVPKDKRFLQRHVRAFTPQTKIGWLALSGVLGYALSAALLVTTLTLGISVAGLSMGLMAVMATGAFIASALGFMAFVLFTSAFVVGALAFTALSGYVVGSSSLAVMRHITQLVFGNGAAKSKSDFPTEEIQQRSTAVTTTSTVITAAAAAAAAAGPWEIAEATNESKAEKASTTTTTPPYPATARPSTYAAPHAVLPPIRTISPTKKRSSPTAVSQVPPPSPPAVASTGASDQEVEPFKQEKQPELPPLSPSSSSSTSTAAKYAITPKTAAAAAEAPEAKTAEVVDTIVSSLDREKATELRDVLQGEKPSAASAVPKPIDNTTNNFIAIKTNSTTPSGTRTITMIKPSNKKKTSFPAPLPGPPPSTTGHLKPISPAPSADLATLDCCTQDPSLLFSSSPSPSMNSDNKNVNEIDSNDSPGVFTSVMQGWKEIEKKAALESPNGGLTKLPIPSKNNNSSSTIGETNTSNKSKSKGKGSRKSSPKHAFGVEGVAVLDLKTPDTS